MENMKENTCCFFGHREITKTDKLEEALNKVIERLIVKEKINNFIFGSRSQFNDLCYDVVTRFKLKYPHIRRIYVRAEYADVNDDYVEYLLGYYEETYYPDKLRGAGKASYVQRNFEMISRSKYCVVYFDEKYLPPTRKNGYQTKSGTAIAYNFAVRKKVKIINVYYDE